MDVKNIKKWAIIVRPAGSNALFAYLLEPIVTIIIMIFGCLTGIMFFFDLSHSFTGGFIRAIIFAFALTWLAGGLRKVGIWLKL